MLFKNSPQKSLEHHGDKSSNGLDSSITFKEIYYYLYSNSNLPRAERLSAEFIKILFCKMYNDSTGKHYFRDILALPDKEAVELFNKLFDDVKKTYPDIFSEKEHIQLDIKSIKYIAAQIEQLSFSDTNRDILADAFQSFISPAVRGEKGQFFTPQSAAIMMADILQPCIGEYILDPACGSGTFLALVYKKLIEEFNNASNKNGLKNPANSIFGIDKEFDLARICKTYLALQGDGRSGIFCFDSLDRTTWPDEIIALAKNGFDVIITNPPFGTKIGITNQKILRNYSLAHKWAFSKSENRWKITNTLLPKQDPQVLFIELCTQLLKPNGRLGIVLPEGIIANKQSGYILDFLRSQGDIFGVIDCPRTLFQPSTDIKTVILFFKKKIDNKKNNRATNQLFMAVVNDCGHDRRGRTKLDSNGSFNSEFENIGKAFRNKNTSSRLGFWVREEDIDPYYLIPRYYNPEISNELDALRKEDKVDLIALGDLESNGIIRIFRGYEPGSESYGTGKIPFIRTSDISNWELTFDPTIAVSEDVYNEISKNITYKPNDILIVNDGRYRIGNCAMLTVENTKIVIQSHIRIIRVLKPNILNPYLLFYLMQSPLVQNQIKQRICIQSTIATLGSRLKEVALPIPKDKKIIKYIEKNIEKIISQRSILLKEAMMLGEKVSLR